MTRLRLGFVLAISVLAMGSSARAQIANLPPGFGTNTFDPFSAYFGYYLPRNQSIAAQMAGSSTESINLHSQARRANAEAARASALYDLSDPYRSVPIEDRPFTRPATILLPGQPAGPAPAGYFGRSERYFYGARSGAPGAVRGGNVAARLPQGGMGRGGAGIRGGRMGGGGGMRGGRAGGGGMGGGRGGAGGFGGFGGFR